MRTFLFNRIKALAGIPAPFGSGSSRRVVSSGAADQPNKPFMIVQMGVEQPWPGMPQSSGGAQIPFTVWVHDVPGSMVLIDDACVALKDGLPLPAALAVGNMSLYEIRWTGISEDSYDDHYNTNCRPVRFTMATRR